jgi:hypothetical protein
MYPPPLVRSWLGTLACTLGLHLAKTPPAWFTFQNFAFAATGLAALGSFLLTMQAYFKRRRQQ